MATSSRGAIAPRLQSLSGAGASRPCHAPDASVSSGQGADANLPCDLTPALDVLRRLGDASPDAAAPSRAGPPLQASPETGVCSGGLQGVPVLPAGGNSMPTVRAITNPAGSDDLTAPVLAVPPWLAMLDGQEVGDPLTRAAVSLSEGRSRPAADPPAGAQATRAAAAQAREQDLLQAAEIHAAMKVDRQRTRQRIQALWADLATECMRIWFEVMLARQKVIDDMFEKWCKLLVGG